MRAFLPSFGQVVQGQDDSKPYKTNVLVLWYRGSQYQTKPPSVLVYKRHDHYQPYTSTRQEMSTSRIVQYVSQAALPVFVSDEADFWDFCDRHFKWQLHVHEALRLQLRSCMAIVLQPELTATNFPVYFAMKKPLVILFHDKATSALHDQLGQAGKANAFPGLTLAWMAA